MLGNQGDFPGVVSKKKKVWFAEVCPNPILSLKI